MSFPRLVVLALVGALWSSGCVGLADEPGAGEDARVAPAAAAHDVPFAAAPLSYAPPADPPLSKREVPLALELLDSWVRPRQPFEARAVAPEGARVLWYVEAVGGDAHVTPIEGYLYVGGAPSAAEDETHSHLPPRHAPVETGAIAAGESTRGFAFWKEGRYVLVAEGAPDARVNVTVNASERARDVAHVTLLEDDHGLRFSPSELSIHPETRVRFWNADDAPRAVVESRFLAAVPYEGRAPRFVGVHPGAYEVVAVAREGDDGWAERSARLLVDFDGPSARTPLGPFEGRVSSLDTPDAPPSRAHAFSLAHPVRALHLELRVTSTVDALPPEATWRLLHEGEEVAAAASTATSLDAEDLPSGNYTLSIETAGGGPASYSAWGEARHVLRAPDSPDS